MKRTNPTADPDKAQALPAAKSPSAPKPSAKTPSAKAADPSEAKLNRLLNVIPYAIAYTDREGRLVRTNAAHDAMLGYGPGGSHGKMIWEFFLPEDRQAEEDDFFFKLKEQPEPSPKYGRLVRKDGTLVNVMYHWTYDIDDDGNLAGFIAITTDISQELRAKDELEAAKAEAERTRDEKSRFLAAASHDLQQPLHSLSILLGLLKENQNKNRREEILTQMELALEGAQALLGAVLELSKLEARVVKPRLEAIAVSDLFEQLAADFGPQFMHSPVLLKIHPTKLVIKSDRVLLKSIMHNLLSNAFRYTEQGKVLLVARRRGASVLLQVWDTGIGIPADKQKEIFHEFTRLHPEHQVAGQAHALGLGLSIVERACELLGHKITLRSQPGKGSVFSLEVPFLMVDRAVRKSARFARDFPYQILIIEDDYRQAKNTKDLLASWGYTAVIAKNRAQVQTAIKAQSFDLILADYNLQNGANGISIAMEACKTLNKKLPIILMTAESDPAVYQFAGANGIEVLAKPARPARLRALMDYVLTTRNGD